LVLNSSYLQLAAKDQLLGVIRGFDPGDLDAREQRMRAVAGGAPYRQLLSEFYPQLRRSDYTIGYTVAPFTVERGKEVMKTRPGDLSLNEMFLIAGTYAPGSREFNEVFETAARIFPGNDVANLNAAANALERKDAASAARYLDRVKEHNDAYWNELGVLSWLQGDKQKAAECFAKGGAQGMVNAAELDRHLRSINPVSE
jgi:hypothetical protein